MKKCAYCNKEEKLSREHVIPAFIYGFQKEYSKKFSGWNEVIGKRVGGETQIKDVCEKCNNEILGNLDSYAKKLFVESGLLVKTTKKNK